MRLLLTGASGQLGAYLLREGSRRGDPIVAWSGSQRGDMFGCTLRPVDLTDAETVAMAFREARPDVVIHTAALAGVADCHRQPARAKQINNRGSDLLAELADHARARFIHVSTDMVFDGERGHYQEEDAVGPLSVYGRTKAEAERAVLTRPRTLVVRLSLLFGPSLGGGRRTFFDEQTAALREGRPLALFHDEWRTPLSLLAAARGLLDLAASDAVGLLHIGGPERLSRLEMGLRLAASLGYKPDGIVSVSRLSARAVEPRPRDLSLNCSKWRESSPQSYWPDWQDALRDMMPSPTAEPFVS
jgi:dTDP-4-dehydrorhamnose reductase